MTRLCKVLYLLHAYYCQCHLYLVCFLEIFFDPVSYCLIKESAGKEN